jgi:hypothetical protein
MKLVRFSKNKKAKKILLLSLVILLLSGGLIIYRSFAIFKEEKTFNVLKGIVPEFYNSDIEIAYTVDGVSVDEAPESGSYGVFVSCDNNATGKWDYDKWGIVVTNLSSTGTTCTVNFNSNFVLSDYSITNMYAGNTDTTSAKNSLTVTSDGTTATIKTDYISCDSTLTTSSTVAVKFKLTAGKYNIYMESFGTNTNFNVNGKSYSATGTTGSNGYLNTILIITDDSSYVTLQMTNSSGGYVRMNATISYAS